VIFPEILGHERPREVLAKILASGRVPHALLFHGVEGVGKRTVALRLAASLLCDAPHADSREACGVCAACRKAAHGNHPDLLLVTRLPKEGSEEDATEGEVRSVISIAQIRDMASHASYAPREGPRRVFVIDPADRLTLEAQNALLKTLEEPPGRGVVLLVAARPHALLGTVRSRCFQIGFGSMPPASLAEALAGRGMNEDEARRRAALSDGRPGHALTLDVAALGARRDALLDALCDLATSTRGVARLGEHAAALVGEDEADLVEGIDLVAALARDAARVASGRAEILHADAAAQVADLARSLGASRAAEIVALAERLRGDLRGNANKTLVAETLLAAVAGAATPAA
jgi:DNA polymerase-3 subunit delta'